MTTEQDILELRCQNHGYGTIAKRLKVACKTVRYWCRKKGLGGVRGKTYPPHPKNCPTCNDRLRGGGPKYCGKTCELGINKYTGLKTCKICDQAKPPDQFQKDGRHTCCACISKEGKERNQIPNGRKCEVCSKDLTGNAKYYCPQCKGKATGQTRYRLNRIGIPTDHKRCGGCKRVKPFVEFNFSSSTDDGYDPTCRDCKKIEFAEYISQPGKHEAKLSQQRAKGLTRKQRDIKNDRQNTARNQRKGVDPKYKLNEGIRRSIGMSLKRRGGSKNGRHWGDLVGYTLDAIKSHLESLFLPGMTWDNYGKWHIDHIIPISLFNFTCPEDADFKKCWALGNLRPLWGPDNLRKGSKLFMEYL